MRILVTGAGGQLGRALREVADDGEWMFTDMVGTSPPASTAGLVGLDITDCDAVEAFFERERPDVVVNCAAFTDVDRAETECEAAFRVNRDAARFLAEASAKWNVALIHISTDFVFDGLSDRPYTEEDAPAPLNVYGESKLAGEREVYESRCHGAVIRTSWLYSPWGRNFVRSILGAAEKNSEIRVVADQSGCPTSAVSLAGAIITMIPSIVAGSSRAEVYHFCDTGVVSRADFAAEIVRQAGLACRVVPVSTAEYDLQYVSNSQTAAIRPACSALSTTKITSAFGIVTRPWQEALAECIKRLLYGC